MKSFEIKKSSLDKSFTGINTAVLGQAAGELKQCGLKLYLYLAGNKNGFAWTLNPAAYATWLGMDYASKGRTVRKAIEDGLADLIANGYVVVIDEKEEKYVFSEQKVPQTASVNEDNEKMEQKVPKSVDFVF